MDLDNIRALRLKEREIISKHDSPYVNSSVVTIQAMVKPIVNKDEGYYVPSRSIVFSYNEERKKSKRNCIVPSAFSHALTLDETQSIIDGADDVMNKKVSSMKILGVTIDGIENSKDAKEFPDECGRLAIAIHGAVSVFCDTRLLNEETPYYGDPIYAYPIHSNGLMRHGKHDYHLCIVTKELEDRKFILGTYLEHDANELRVHLKH